MAAGQGELDLGLEPVGRDGDRGGPLPITASRMSHLWDALRHGYEVLGLHRAAGEDEVFAQLVLVSGYPSKCRGRDGSSCRATAAAPRPDVDEPPGRADDAPVADVRRLGLLACFDDRGEFTVRADVARVERAARRRG